MSFKAFPINRRYAYTWQHHQARYVFALSYCFRKIVLDAGSQMGFGAHQISYVANKVILSDINLKALTMAQELNKFMCPTEFIQADYEKEFPDVKNLDIVTAFEVIEHLHDPNLFLQNIKKSLKLGGRLIFSVPHMVMAQDHKQLYDEKKIKNLISKYFTIESFYIQDSTPISNRPMYKGLKCYVGVAIKKDENNKKV